MASLNEISDSIADMLNKSEDFAFKERIKFSVKYWRATLVKREAEKNGINGEFLQSTLICLEKVDKIDACNLEINCSILKSKDLVPVPLRLKGINSFIFVGTADGRAPFSQCYLEELDYKTKLKYTGNRIYYNYMNGYLYIYNNTKIKFARLTGIFANPEDLNSCSCDEYGDSTECYNDNLDFPIPADLIATIIQGLVSGELRFMNIDDKEVDINTEANDKD